ncbi:hypothetical protein [Clostridium sp. BJN0013]|uniref:hypothetical protein n=1 Tax=Clostridium sp. BJN0013 TaxID=3236840 RepID=UPI0034C64752
MLNKHKKNPKTRQYHVQITNFPKNKFALIASIISAIVSLTSLAFSIGQYYQNYQITKEQALKSQAQTISAWIKEDQDNQDNNTVALNNLSNEPVYDVVVTVVTIGNSGSYAENGLQLRKYPNETEEQLSTNRNGVALSILPPGKYKAKMPYISHGMSRKFGVEVAFRDFQNNCWVISGNGHLSQISKDPFKYYDLPSPIDFGSIQNQ